MNGTVKWYRREKGYGFITGEDGEDYFVHYTALPQDTDNIDGKKVTFDGKPTERGSQAENIVFVEGEESSEEESKEDSE